MIPDLIEIPAGQFLLGDNALRDATPQHSLELAAFRIGKFPVTNREYAEFIADNGYARKNFGSAMGARWLESRKIIAPGFWRDPQFNAPRQPVVGVSWYEAVAYCEWLREKFSRQFRLPSEAEWEKAARGDRAAQIFPWGDAYDAQRANTAELGIGHTTTVDAFPRGASPYGVMDLAGNIFEWTRSKWGANWQALEFAYPYRADDGREEIPGSAARVMRGGSWFNSAREARVSHRARYLPGSRASNIGFRVAEMLTPAEPIVGNEIRKE
ncbi:MAG: formylglycine-generating enzyme family protein [Chloroflexi bacterium]|nr:formylglycine-generating enzyme family protein [Chloroflexota bacterium]